MFFSVGVETPKDDHTAYGITVPVLIALILDVFLLLILRQKYPQWRVKRYWQSWKRW